MEATQETVLLEAVVLSLYERIYIVINKLNYMIWNTVTNSLTRVITILEALRSFFLKMTAEVSKRINPEKMWGEIYWDMNDTSSLSKGDYIICGKYDEVCKVKTICRGLVITDAPYHTSIEVIMDTPNHKVKITTLTNVCTSFMIPKIRSIVDGKEYKFYNDPVSIKDLHSRCPIGVQKYIHYVMYKHTDRVLPVSITSHNPIIYGD